MSSSRPNLLWFGRPASSAVSNACEERGLIIKVNPTVTTAGEYSSARGLVISFGEDPESETQTVANAERLRTGLWHGLCCFVLAPLRRIPSVQSFLGSLVFGPQIVLWEASRESYVPESIARAPADASWSNTIDVKGEESLCEEDRVLLRRAFCDCTTVSLVAETGGRSAKVFCVYARLKDSAAGRLPLPFFAKFDRFPKIRRELGNYRDHTTLFIPFNQRPNVDISRCVLGADRGLIVGNFVEESETLGELVERGTARGAIHSLFGGALRGWRTQTYFDDAMAVFPSIVYSLEFCLPSKYRSARRERLARCARAARTLGATLAPAELEDMLRGLPPFQHRRSMSHGDLHGANVRVCRDEAILIDFASTQTRPLMADPASLDVSLVMDSKRLVGDSWATLAKEAYDLQNLRALPAPRDPSRPDAALWNSIRQLRQIALADQLSEFEYAATVALYLLRRASYSKELNEPLGRREMAYFLAEVIAKQLTSELLRATAA